MACRRSARWVTCNRAEIVKRPLVQVDLVQYPAALKLRRVVRLRFHPKMKAGLPRPRGAIAGRPATNAPIGGASGREPADEMLA